MLQILVLGNDEAVQSSLQVLFESEGYGVQVAASISEGVELFRADPPNVLLLDLRLLEYSEPEAFHQVQQLAFPTPVIVLGRSSLMERIRFLELGADDYVTKPFSERELLARVRAAIRRSMCTPGPDVFAFGDVTVNFCTMELQRQGNLVSLTSREFNVLKFMLQNAGRAISRQELLNEVWGYQNYPETRTVDNCIMKLRQKLERDPSYPLYFRTVHGVGYKFVVHEGHDQL
jgi:DNA-binding response OmpR family regulator